MSLTQETIVRRIGKEIFLVEGLWNDTSHLGMGFGNHPEVLFPKERLLQVGTQSKADMDDTLADDLIKLQDEARQALMLDAVASYQFVSACIEAGYDIERDGSNVACWVVDQLQEAARRDPAPKSALKRRAHSPR